MSTKITKKVLLFLICFFCVNVFVIYFINQERFIYFWDYAGYWYKYQYLSESFKNGPLNALRILINSIRNDDYNFLPVFFLIPFNFLFGNERLAYILSIANIFALPSIFLFCLLIEKIFSQFYDKKYFGIYFLSISTVVLFPQLWIPIIRGEVGVIGVFIIALIFLIYLKEPIEKQNYLSLLLIGFLFSFLILIRRWYTYWVVSFFIVLIFERFIIIFKQYRFSIKQYLPSARNIFVIGITSVIFFLLIATPIAERMLLANYADIYSAYRTNYNILDALIKFYHYFGSFSILLCLLGCIQLIANKDMKKFALFFIAQFIIITLLFTRVQDFGPQHYYLLIPTIIIFIVFFVINLFLHLEKRIYKSVFLMGYMVILLINFSIVFIPRVSDNLAKISFLFPNVRCYPLVRNDLKEIEDLLSSLENLSNNKKGLFYVLSGSDILNDDILRNACLENKHTSTICKSILLSHYVDKRDGFPSQFLTAQYIVTADPVQFHLRPDDQRVIGILADEIINQKGIGSSFKKLNYEFTLDNNVKVHIYEKIKQFKGIDLDSLSQQFITYYPDKKDIFKINNTLCGLILKKEIGDIVGEISCQKDSIFTVPGVRSPSKIFFKLNKNYNNIKMLFAFRDPEKVPLSCRDIDGEINLTIKSDGKTIFEKNITYKQPMNYLLDVRDVDILGIVVDNGRNGPDCDWFMLKDIEID